MIYPTVLVGLAKENPQKILMVPASVFLIAGGKIDPLRALREEDPALIAKEEMRQVQDYFQDCESQLNKVKVQKNTYQPGVWNCGTVLLGKLINYRVCVIEL